MKFSTFILFLFISIFGFSQNSEKKILFKGTSLWYAAENQLLFSTNDEGKNWDTIFEKRNFKSIVFFNGEFDTATNVFISDQRTLFVFGWDGTMHYQTKLYSSLDCGKTWNETQFQGIDGVVGVKYFHKIASEKFFLYLRDGRYAISNDSGKSWTYKIIHPMNFLHHFGKKYYCFDDFVQFNPNGEMRISCARDKKCMKRKNMRSTDGGITWYHYKA